MKKQKINLDIRKENTKVATNNFLSTLENIAGKNKNLIINASIIFSENKSDKVYSEMLDCIKKKLKGNYATIKTNATRNLKSGLGLLKYIEENKKQVDFLQSYDSLYSSLYSLIENDKLTINKLYDLSKNKVKNKENNEDNQDNENNENNENNEVIENLDNISKESESFNDKLLKLIEEYENLDNLEKYDILSNACDIVYSKLTKEEKKKVA